MRGLKPKLGINTTDPFSRIFYRCVDWNFWADAGGTLAFGRIFYRCVDWNLLCSWKRNEGFVASFTDAWIETGVGATFQSPAAVASFTDAWIETGNMTLYHIPLRSHLLQMRGLKQYNTSKSNTIASRIFYRCVDWNCRWYSFSYRWNVASFTDAWIETSITWHLEKAILSHLLQMRGLKLKFKRFFGVKAGSHLLQMRGLKLCGWCFIWIWFRVASFTDAWIETKRRIMQARRRESHLLQMRGLKPLSHLLMLLVQLVASFTDAWIETWNECRRVYSKSRIFYRCVDWNITNIKFFWNVFCRIFYRCVDWNIVMLLFLSSSKSRIFYRCVDWNLFKI